MGLKERYDFESLVNDAERLVIAEMKRQLAGHPDVCTCQECVLDIAASALNHVHPRYRANLLGSIYARWTDDPHNAQEIQQAVAEAIRRIRANPAHD